MKILFGIQSTGNGHLTRSAKVINKLIKYGYQVDVLLSGNNSQVKFPFPIKWNLRGLTFYYDGKGGIDYWKTFNELKFFQFLKDIKLNLSEYSLIISDYEPITAWAAKMQERECIGISNQCSFLSKKIPRATKGDLLGELILKKFAPVTKPIGIHFDNYDDFIFTPILRDNLLNMDVKDQGHFTVYLPNFDMEHILTEIFSIRSTKFEIFTNIKKPVYIKKNYIKPIDKSAFEESLRNCHGVITSGGFQTAVEALYLGKKLMVIPTPGQYEQQCNAVALDNLGVMTGDIKKVKKFIEQGKVVKMDWEDSTDKIIEYILKN